MARARRALQEAGLDMEMPLRRADSVTNEVWFGEEYVIRVNRRLDPRLRREAYLAPYLPPEVGYPEVVAYGGKPGADWLIVRQVPGQVLSRAWPTMSKIERREAVHQLAMRLMALHKTAPPPNLPDISDSTPQLLSPDTFTPVMPLLVAIDKARTFPNLDKELFDEAEELVIALAGSITPFEATGLVHGDLTFENIMWDGKQISAVLDFEWSRPAPCDLDLDVLLRFCALPHLHVAPDYEHLARPVDYQDVPWWLAKDYPALFAFSDQYSRMRLFAMAYDLRDLVKHPPEGSVDDLWEHHPYHRLAATVRGTGYLSQLNR